MNVSKNNLFGIAVLSIAVAAMTYAWQKGLLAPVDADPTMDPQAAGSMAPDEGQPQTSVAEQSAELGPSAADPAPIGAAAYEAAVPTAQTAPTDSKTRERRKSAERPRPNPPRPRSDRSPRRESETPPPPPPPVIQEPFWRTQAEPSRASQYYPQRAAREGVTGFARVQCSINRYGQLFDCYALEESPRGYGFAEAVASIMTREMVASPRTQDGVAQDGGRISYALRFQ